MHDMYAWNAVDACASVSVWLVPAVAKGIGEALRGFSIVLSVKHKLRIDTSAIDASHTAYHDQEQDL